MAIIRVTNVPSTALSDDVITSAKIADGTIAVSDLANDSVTAEKIASNAVTSAKVADGAITTGHMHSSVPLGTKNLIINGDMRIAQRGTSATGLTNGSAGYHTVDRFIFYEGGTPTSVFTQTQDTDVPTGQGFVNSLKMQCTTAQTSLSSLTQVRIEQRIEAQNLQHLAYGTSNAKTVTLSFWVKSNKTGTYILNIYQADDNRTISKPYTIDTVDTWEKKTITIEGDTAGTINNDNGVGWYVIWGLSVSSDYASGTLQTSWGAYTSSDWMVGQANLADSTSNYWQITGVQLEVGTEATPFEHRPYDMELQRCQRYYEKSYSDGVVPGTATASGICYFYVARTTSNGYGLYTNRFAVTKRANASVTLYSQSGTLGQVSDADSGTNTGSADVIHNGTGSFLARNISGGSISAKAIGWHFVAQSEL